MSECKCVVIKSDYPAQYDQYLCPIHGPHAPRYFIDHGMIHDRITGKHVEQEEVVRILNLLPVDHDR